VRTLCQWPLTFHFSFPRSIRSAEANLAPKAVPLSIVKSHFAGKLRAKPLFTSRRTTLHFQIIKPLPACELHAEGGSTFNLQFSTFNCETLSTGETRAKPLFTSRRTALHFQIIKPLPACEPHAEGDSTLHSKLAPRAEGRSTFNSQFSILNSPPIFPHLNTQFLNCVRGQKT
jgi:hypothetical protein